MKICDEDLRRFQELYKEHFDEEITVSEATERAISLISLLKAVVLEKMKKP